MARKKSVPGPLTLHHSAESGIKGAKQQQQQHQQHQQPQQRQQQSQEEDQQRQRQRQQLHYHTQQQQQQHHHNQQQQQQQPRQRAHTTNGDSRSHSVNSNTPTPDETSRALSPEAPGSVRSLSPNLSPRSLYTSKFSPHNQGNNGHPSQPSPGSQQSQEAIAISPRKGSPQQVPSPQPQPQRERRQHPNPQDSPAVSSSSSSSSPSPHETKQPHIAELQQRLPATTGAAAPYSSSSSSTAAAHHQKSRQHHQHQTDRRLKSSHGRRREEGVSPPGSNNNNKQGFFSNFHKSSKSSDRLPLQPQGAQTVAWPYDAMNGSDHPPITIHSSKQSEAPSLPPRTEPSIAGGDPNSTSTSTTKKASKPKPFTLLSRTKSHREKEGRSPRHTPSPQEMRDTAAAPKTAAMLDLERPEQAHVPPAPKTAMIPHDRAFREAMSSASRNHSADRAPSRDASSDRRGHQDREHARHQSTPRDGNGATSFFNNLRREGGRVAESIGKGLFGKGGRSASTTERDLVDDEHYVLKVINLPLVEQTRLTRISKRLEESRDKTEFWMPAFPWRAIDYLNYKGCDVEGLYRVPGSGPQVKKWQRRFDEQYDVDLFQQDDLYDINIIGSMLKAWLRELPDELFPKEAQDRVARECAGSEKVPQLLIDELSSLSPFNYYLLFAITCHLSLLLAHSDKNKMDFRNLCICFQPCMKIDAFCFKFLVCDWRDCWKGCKTEGRYIEEEYKLFDQPPPPGLGVRKKLEPRLESRDERRRSPGLDRDERERNISSSDGNSRKSPHGGDQVRLKKKSPPPLENGKENGITAPKSANATLSDGRGLTTQDGNDLRPLSPIKPLSPLGF